MSTVGQKLTRGGLNRCAICVPVTVTAVTNTDFTFQLPAGARDVTFRTKTITAFGAVTDAQLSIGNAAAGAQYVAAVSIKAAGQVAHTLAGGAMSELDTVPGAPGSMTTIYGRVAQSGGNSATGLATLIVEYSVQN